MPRLSKIGAAALAAFGWTSGVSAVSVSYLAVAGGGGGGGMIGGGGGAGGYQAGTTSLNPTLSYTVIVGAGGAGTASAYVEGNQGSNSSFSTITANGGGKGGAPFVTTDTSGGSSGGAGGFGTRTGTASQGNLGGTTGWSGAGGGGAGAVGADTPNSNVNGGAGGAGTANSITGTSVTYAGGGGGGSYRASGGAGGAGGGGAGGAFAGGVGVSGTANLGGGGGGGGDNSPGAGGAGGSGVVIISYVGAQQFGGGVVTSSGGNTIHTFNTSGTLSPLSSLTASYLVVAGGGSGGNDRAGGGGAGGLLSGSGVTIDTNSTYLVTVGAGGATQTGGGGTGFVGSNSTFSMVTTAAVGGGGGYRSSGGGSSANGGSGGGGDPTGGAGTGTVGQGNNGGAGASSYGSGGGGGAGAVGGSAVGNASGSGGVGLTSSISGTSTYYAGGGGAGGYAPGGGSAGTGGLGGGGDGNSSNGGAGTAGTANLGGGGGGGGASNGNGGAGGSGIVIISYPGATQQMAGGTVTVAGGNVIHTFTSSGYLAPIFTANNSLRFRSSASAYLNRTPTNAATSTTKGTISIWFKGIGQANQYLVGKNSGTIFYLYFNSSNQLVWQNGGVNTFITTQVFRDPSSWYHLVASWDTTQATSSDRQSLYLNGQQITAFGTTNNLGSSATVSWFDNDGNSRNIGAYTGGGYFDGYMAEINAIDGQALTPNSFGYYSDLGVWQPIRYGGSYGTNGFYLPFTAGTSTFIGSYNGTTAWFNAANNAAFAFGTGSLTVEAWVYPTQNSYGAIFDTRSSGSGGPGMSIYANSGSGIILVNNTTYNPSTYLSLNQWSHIAAVRNGASSWTVYINGISVLTFTDASNLTDNACFSGKNYAGTFFFGGFISNLRVVKGTAVYTSNFAPSTSPLTNISGTSLLTLQNSTLIDNSTNAFSLTNTGPITTLGAYIFNFLNGTFKDSSPQGNNWTYNNISTALGSTCDLMTDVPTLTSATTANYATLNPLQLSAGGSPVTSNGNLRLSSSLSGYPQAGCTFGTAINGFKGYFEVTLTGGNDVQVGFNYASAAITNTDYTSTGCIYVNSTGNLFNSNSTTVQSSYITAPSTGGVIMVAFDFTGSNKNIWWGYNGTWGNRGGVGVPSTGTNPGITVTEMTSAATRLYLTTGGSSNTPDYNFGQQPFSYTPPTGFVALNTFNLTTPTIGATASSQANDYFDVSLWTGNGTSQSITNSGSMQPDFVWYKGRSTTFNHGLFDSIRGTLQRLSSNLTSAESTTAGSLTAFNSNGFSVGSDAGANQTSDTYVAWQWRASNTTPVSNTQGSITSTVSASTTAGFSIVTYTGNGTAGATWGHGLGVAPSFVIVKGRTNVDNWMTWHTSYGGGQYFIELNTTNALGSATNVWNNTVPTSSVVTVGTGGTVNTSSVNYVAYCFAQIAGYSAFGSYTGNGSTDGTFVYTGFRPRYVMIKASSTGGAGYDWFIHDTARDTYNACTKDLEANLSLSEDQYGAEQDFLSNGFKLRNTGGGTNQNGVTYIYMAFCENPLKYANAR